MSYYDGARFNMNAIDPIEHRSGAVELFHGSRSELLPLFAEADDSRTEIDSYIQLGEVLVVRRAQRIVGHVQLIAVGSDWEIKSVAVIEERRRQGVGTALVRAAVDRAFSEGAVCVRVATATADIDNLRFYQRLGFRMDRVDRNAFSVERGYPGAEVHNIPICDRVWFSISCEGAARSTPMPVKRPEGQAMQDLNAQVSDDATHHDLEFLEEQVNEYNFATTGIRDARLLVILLRDSASRIYAGLSGHTWGGVGEVRFLWVDASKRHMGIGTRLLRAAEEEARARGCRKVVLSTHSFQAPDFYRKLGYVIAGKFSDYPAGHSSMFLEKPLR